MNGVDAKVSESRPHERKVEDEDAIESDVQNLLEEMATTFKSFSESVFAKVDKLTGKIDTLQKSVDMLSTNDSKPLSREPTPELNAAPLKE